MSRSQVGIIRHASVASAIVNALGAEPEPECRIGQWRITLTFRGLGASRWNEDRQIEYALRAAAVTRSVLSDDRRGAMRTRANRAIEVVYEDAAALRRGWTLLGFAVGSLLVALYAITGILTAAMLTGSRLAVLIYTLIFLVSITTFVRLLVAFIRVLRHRIRVPIPES